MTQTSSVVTGGVTVSAATLAPLVNWALGGFPQPIPESVPYLITAAILTIGHAIYNVAIGRQQEAPTPSAAPSSQSGYALPGLLLILPIVAMVVLTGCANVQQAIGAAEASAVVSVRAAEDNNIKVWAANACGTPFSAAIRNPQIVPALRALCLPAGDQASPVMLLDAVTEKK